MTPQLRACFCIGVLASVLNWSPGALAAIVVQCQLVMDGARLPPGDRVDCVLRLNPEDRDVRLEVRVFLLSGEHEPQLVPIKASGERNRDERGQVRVSEEVPTTQLTLEKSIVIPYADLSIPVGEHRLAYQVNLHVQGQTAWTKLLPVTRAQISDHASPQHMPQIVSRAETVQSKTAKALIGNSSGKIGDRRIRIEEAVTAKVPELNPASVSVIRSFERAPLNETTKVDEKTMGLAGQPWQPFSEVAKPEERIVYFATNRMADHITNVRDASYRLTFGADLSENLSQGSCVVNFPIRYHKRGVLEVASWFVHSDPDKHFLVEALQELSRDAVLRPLREKDVLIYVHGFNTTFNDAVLRAGQLQYDTDFPGNVVAFSWPSIGSATIDDYKRDIERAEKSVLALSDLLEFVTRASAQSIPPRKVHVIAHSLGNRLLLAAVYDLAHRDVWKPDQKYLGQIILAAPDVGAIRFNNVIEYAIRPAERVSYYYCRSDGALKMSQTINKYEPVGLYPFFQKGLDTINADGVDTSFLGHGYYGSSEKVLSDFNLLLCNNYEPSQRMPPLASHTRVYDYDHWSFLPVRIQEE